MGYWRLLSEQYRFDFISKIIVLRILDHDCSYTDNGDAYDRFLPEDKHLIVQRFTQSIERQNLKFRIRSKRLQRKILCFSKSVEMHDKVIGAFINRELFQLLEIMTFL